VDALSHALIAAIILLASGLPDFIPFAVLGAVIIDADILFAWISDSNPCLYFLTHGGIAHSIPGATVMSLLAYAVTGVLLITGVIPSLVFIQAGIGGIFAVLAGAYLHVFIDYLACPGTPLFWPVSERKLTAGILPGPSVVLFLTSVFSLTLLALGAASLFGITGLFCTALVLFLGVRVALFLYVTLRYHNQGRLIPAIHRLCWLVIGETPRAFLVRHLVLFKGMTGTETFEKFNRTGEDEVRRYSQLPEVRRLKFHSYIVTAEKDGSTLVFSDPLREKGYVYYPPAFRRVAIPLKDTA